MPNSFLSFASSSSFRNVLMAKNLAPYNVQGVYSPQVGNLTYETVLGDSQVIDSPNDLIANDPYAKILYPLNEYGPTGGYNTNISFNGPLLPVTPNQGPYAPTQSLVLTNSNYFLNVDRFSPYISNIFTPDGGYNEIFDVITKAFTYRYATLYGSTFVPSSYSPLSILLSNDPSGSNGLLSQDSFIAKIGALRLQGLFKDRIDVEIRKRTIGRVNLEAFQDPFEISLLLSGQQPLIFKDWQITVAGNPIIAAGDLATRISGSYWPVSLIPGDYFEDNTKNGQTKQTSNALNVVNQLTGGFLGPILNKKRNPSEIFLANTGNGQRSVLFANIDYNRYQPSYRKDYGGLLGVIQGVVNLAIDLISPSNGTLVGGYYVGSRNAEPSTITSPANQVPVDSFGKQLESPVYGPSELGILFEGNDGRLNFGLAGKSYSDGGGIDGGLVWTSPKYKQNAGFHAIIGGGSGSKDGEFNTISSDYTKSESTNIDFKDGSILDQTQRLIDSADNVTGIKRLKHVGNAMNQVSKVFHDGYKEITKGSKVVSYQDNTTGDEKGTEYCRIFTKDTPYYTYADLQKSDGITTSGRKFTNSVLDNAYNLNIAPLRGSGKDRIGSTNIQNIGGKTVAKKYMFSIENLAWRTSSKPGFRVEDLPVCEQGPNGGRVMWFPPYGLTFSDSSTANFKSTEFLGRPEPMYTYNNTRRSGTLSWKIIVDNPSVMNLIVEKQLRGKNKEKIDSVLDSFFAGCTKYDIYNLAQKFNMIPSNDLSLYQEILNDPNLNTEDYVAIKRGINADANINTDPKENADPSITNLKDTYLNYGYYFDNDTPDPNSRGVSSSESYDVTYNRYTDSGNMGTYKTNSEGAFNAAQSYCKSNPGYCENQKKVTDFFDNVVKSNYEKLSKQFITDLYNFLSEKKGKVTINMIGSASSSAELDYNINLSKRRTDSVEQYLKKVTVGDAKLTNFFTDGSLKVNLVGKGETPETVVFPKGSFGAGGDVNCTTEYQNGNGKTKDKIADKYSVNAMACRRVVIQSIDVIPTPPVTPAPVEVKPEIATNTPTQPSPLQKRKDGISKKIIRQLLSECDYFEVIKESDPMVYNSIKEKVKYFNPTFHSMTPEGLNARLTFLNQCVRPGETIPVIGTDNKPRHNDALNTSFGAAPILVLRIGDFFNTKIVPSTLSFTYEPLVLDMNPEGIGVQPMIANVTLSFDIIGGMGLSKPVEELQNALSFNYYANTEIYDERATATEDVSKFDALFAPEFLNEPIKTTVDNKITNDGGNTIGTILTNVPVTNGQTGEISYLTIMDKLLDVTKEYYLNIPNQMESTVKAYNYGVWQLMTQDRLYSKGFLGSSTSKNEFVIYGKPDENVQKKIDSLFTAFIRDIEDPKSTNDNYILSRLFKLNKLTEGDVNKVALNFTKYVQQYQNGFSDGIFKITNNIVQQEQSMVSVFNKVNLVCNKTDGKIIDNQTRVYNLTGRPEASKQNTTNPPADTYVEFTDDCKSVAKKFVEYNTFMVKSKVINDGTNSYTDPGIFKPKTGDLDKAQDSRMFMVLARIFEDKNKLRDFQTKLLSGDLATNKNISFLKRKLNSFCDDFRDIVIAELKAEEKITVNLRKEAEYKKFVDETAYIKGKARKFDYTTVVNPATNNQQDQEIKDLYATKNPNTDNQTFNGKIQFN